MTAVNDLYTIGLTEGAAFFMGWEMAQAGGRDSPDGPWTYVFRGPNTNKPPLVYWSESQAEWYLNLDPTCAVDNVSGPALAMLGTLDTLLNDCYAKVQTWVAGTGSDCSIGWPNAPMSVAACMKTGVLALVGESLFASQDRVSEIAASLSQWKPEVVHLSYGDLTVPDPTDTLALAISIRPKVSGFTSEQSALIGEALDWIAENYQPLLPTHDVTISPKPPSDDYGLTNPWSGNISLGIDIFGLATVKRQLVKTISHELFHAKPSNKLDRFYSAIRSVEFTNENIKFLNNAPGLDSSEHSFIFDAALAIDAHYNQDHSPAVKSLTFAADSGSPQLVNQAGAVVETLPVWSPVMLQFVSDHLLSPQLNH